MAGLTAEGKGLASAGARTMLRHLRARAMSPRRDWNAMGPHIPAWFRARLKKLDSNLVLQFMPTRDVVGKGGVDPIQFPHGCWAICHRMPRTKLLYRRWTFSLVDQMGMPVKPTMTLLHLLRAARDLWRQKNQGKMEQEFDRSLMLAKRDAIQRSKSDIRDGAARTASRIGLRRDNRVSFAGAYRT